MQYEHLTSSQFYAPGPFGQVSRHPYFGREFLIHYNGYGFYFHSEHGFQWQTDFGMY